MPQNIYDDNDFYAAYQQLPRSIEGLVGAPEWPSVRDMLPDLTGLRILDLGCGFGAFARWAIDHGAGEVVALDLSKNMLARARSLTNSDKIEYREADFSRLSDDLKNFDLVYSALALHYIADFSSLCADIHASLKPFGQLVATVEHPIFTAPDSANWLTQPDNRTVWPLNHYFEVGERSTDWFKAGVIKYHRTMTGYLQPLLQGGFQLKDFVEWVPDADQRKQHPDWQNEIHRPMFLLFSATKTSDI